MNRNNIAAMVLTAGAVLGLAACAPEQPTEYETDTVDESGGELIVEDANPEGVDVELPETEMTPVPTEEPTE
jgi:hypothetical protein